MSNSVCEVMIAARKKVKLNDNEHEDRLSALPDCVVLHILSVLNTKHAVRTCVLSTRWKDLWKRLPALILHFDDFGSYNIFTEFVSKVLSLRDSSITLHTLDFKCKTGLMEESHMLKRIMNYAISHNVQRLRLNVTSYIAQIPPSILSCQTLTHLKLSIYPFYDHHETLLPKSLNLPALTSLQLENFTFCVGEPFSTFSRLNSLLISNCTVKGTQTLCISSATLVNLTIYNNSKDYYKIELCTPSLWTFAFSGTPYQKISGSNISSLKHVDIHAEVFPYSGGPPLFLFSWLLEFADIKSLTVTASTLQVLSLIPGLLKFKITSLGNLKSLRVKIDKMQYEFRMALCKVRLRTVKSKKEASEIEKAFALGSEPSPSIPVGIVDFLRQNSPAADVDIIDCTKEPLRLRYL